MEQDQDYTPEEAKRRADALLDRLIHTPPQPNWKPPAKPPKQARSDASKPGKRTGKRSGAPIVA
jgi:hypothetical protein